MIVLSQTYRKIIALHIADDVKEVEVRHIEAVTTCTMFEVSYHDGGGPTKHDARIEGFYTPRKVLGTTHGLREHQYKALGLTKQAFTQDGKLLNYVLIDTKKDRQALVIQDGKYKRHIGTIYDGEFYKRVRRSEHLYQELNAWGIDALFFKGKIVEECHTVKILDTENNVLYTVPVSKFKQYGEYRTYPPHRAQILLPLSYFERTEEYSTNDKLRGVRNKGREEQKDSRPAQT